MSRGVNGRQGIGLNDLKLQFGVGLRCADSIITALSQQLF